jgi:ribonuclease HII
MLIVGIDENGLGPLLGPLVVTGVSFRAPAYDRDALFALAGPELPAADSKRLFGRGRAAAAEAAVLRWLELFGRAADDSAGLERRIVAPSRFAAPCPDPIPGICAGPPLPLPRAGGARAEGRLLGVWDRFDRAGVKPAGVAAHVLCAGAFNRALAEPGMHKLRLDFALMMSAARRLVGPAGGDALVLCGKVGGTAAYGDWLAEEGLAVAAVVREGRDESAYDVRGLGRLCFVRDGDASHLPIAVASMIGKYVRELAVERLNRALGRGGARRASGYRDPVTAGFVEETAAARAAAGIPDACFLRRA